MVPSEDELVAVLADCPSDEQVKLVFKCMDMYGGSITQMTEEHITFTFTPGDGMTCHWIFGNDVTYHDIDSMLKMVEFLDEDYKIH